MVRYGSGKQGMVWHKIIWLDTLYNHMWQERYKDYQRLSIDSKEETLGQVG